MKEGFPCTTCGTGFWRCRAISLQSIEGLFVGENDDEPEFCCPECHHVLSDIHQRASDAADAVFACARKEAKKMNR